MLSKIHIDKDQLLDDKKQSDDDDKKKGSKRDNLIRHLFKIQRNIELYNDKQFNEFLRRTDYPPIRTISDKRTQTVGINIEYLRGTAVDSANIRQSRDKFASEHCLKSLKLRLL